MRVNAIVVSLLLSAQVVAQAAPATYAIKFHRPFTVGTKFELTSNSNVKRVRTIDGVADMNDQNKVVLRGLAEVLEVDAKGRPKRIKFSVTECTTNGKVLVSPGMEMMAERGPKGRPQFLVGGSFLSLDKSQLLADALPLGHEGEPTDDDVFGTPKRQPVGGTWAANGPLAAASFQKQIPGPLTVKGQCKLDAVKKVNGVDCLMITGTVVGSGTMSMNSRMTGAFPVDPKLPRQSEGSNMRFTVTQPRVNVVIESSRSAGYNYNVPEKPHISPAQQATSGTEDGAMPEPAVQPEGSQAQPAEPAVEPGVK